MKKPEITGEIARNASLEYNKEDVPEDIGDYMSRHIRFDPEGDGIVKVYVESDGNRVPVDLHGGNVNECWHGFINTSIFNPKMDRRIQRFNEKCK